MGSQVEKSRLQGMEQATSRELIWFKLFVLKTTSVQPDGKRMSTRLWPVLILAFSAVIGLALLLALVSLWRANEAYSENVRIQQSSRVTEERLQALRDNVFLSSILLRDFFLDSPVERTEEHRRELQETRARIYKQVGELANSTPPGDATFARLRSQIDAYWDSIDPIFSWSRHEKRALGPRFLREQVLTSRDEILDIAEQIGSVNKESFDRQLERVSAGHEEFEREVMNLLVLGLAVGIMVSAISAVLILRRSEQVVGHQRQTERAERELRDLFSRFVGLQEDDRRAISKELQDQVGQRLSSLRIAIRNLGASRQGATNELDPEVEQAEKLIEEASESVCNLAMGLRPPMLDKPELRPALEWQVQDFTRRSGIPVSLRIDDRIEGLSEEQATCIYRIVQEALKNCARHASATEVIVQVMRGAHLLDVLVGDDGKGFESSNGQGVGLRAMQERARELGGSISIASDRGRGTVVSVQIPL